MKALPSSLHELLLAAVAAPAPAGEAWRHWRASADLDHLDATSLALLRLLLRRRPELGADDPWRGRTNGLYRRAWYTNQRLLAAAADGLAALDAAGIRVMAVDDVVTLEQVHRDRGALQLKELALLLEESELPHAAGILERQGWLARAGIRPPSAWARSYARGDGGRLALRTRLLPAPCLAAHSVWTTASRGEIGGVLLPAREAHLLWLLLACVMPPVAAWWVRRLDAGVALADYGADLDWDHFLRLARETRSSYLAVAALRQLQQLCDLAPPAGVVETLAATPPTPAERRYLAACAQGALRHDWALYRLLRQRQAPVDSPPPSTFAGFLLHHRGGGTLAGGLRWAGGAVMRRLRRPGRT